MNRCKLAAAFVAACLLSTAPACGDFTTVVNTPPDVIPPGAIFGANTQINLLPGATDSLGEVIHLGGHNAPAQHTELNVLGGYAWAVEAWTGSELHVVAGSVNAANLLGGQGTMSGGVVNNWAVFADSRLEMSGGVAARVETAGIVDGPAAAASSFVMTGGDVGILDATGSATIRGGTVGNIFFRGSGLVEVSGGTIGDDFEVGSVVVGALADDPTVEIVVGSGGRVIVRGGSIGERMILREARELDFSGGAIGDEFQALAGSRVNIRGSHFLVAGIELILQAGEPLVLTERDVILEGLLADGQPFRFDLSSGPGRGDYFSPAATLTLIAVPEPVPLALLLAALPAAIAGRRRTAP